MSFLGLFHKKAASAPAPAPAPVPAPRPQMSDEDKTAIRDYALEKGDREAAVEVYRRNLPLIGKGGNLYMKFMAEVDTPSPDLGLRSAHRRVLVGK